MLRVIGRVRTGLGNPEALRGPAALLASCRGMALLSRPLLRAGRRDELLRGRGREINWGAGIELAHTSGTEPICVQTVFPGSPAQRAGILPGDVIAAVDGKSTEGRSWEEILVSLNQPAALRLVGAQVIADPNVGQAPEINADTIELTLLRKGGKADRKVTLRREEFQPETVLGVSRRLDNSWDYWLDREQRIAQVRIASLGNETAEDLRSVLAALRGEGLRGLILDLRWTPGGLLTSALATTGLFLKEKTTIAGVEIRYKGATSYFSEGGPKLLDLPMIVLANGDTTGGAELIAAAPTGPWTSQGRRPAHAGQGEHPGSGRPPGARQRLQADDGYFRAAERQELAPFPREYPRRRLGGPARCWNGMPHVGRAGQSPSRSMASPDPSPRFLGRGAAAG